MTLNSYLTRHALKNLKYRLDNIYFAPTFLYNYVTFYILTPNSIPATLPAPVITTAYPFLYVVPSNSGLPSVTLAAKYSNMLPSSIKSSSSLTSRRSAWPTLSHPMDADFVSRCLIYVGQSFCLPFCLFLFFSCTLRVFFVCFSCECDNMLMTVCKCTNIF